MKEHRKLQVIEDVKKFYHTNDRYPSLVELRDQIGCPRRTMRRYFGNLANLIAVAELSIEEPLFTKERSDSLQATIKKHNRFIVTTAAVGAPVFADALKAVKSYCKLNKAGLLIIPAADPSANVSEGLAEELLKENIVIDNIDLNKNIAIYSLKLSAKQINPTTGLGRIGQRNKSFIFASPKQNLEFVSVGNNKMPHALMTTGAITLPAYGKDFYMSHRTSFIAEHDHIQGAVIVEIVNDELYHFRHIEFNDDGSFTDLGTTYKANGKAKDSKTLAIVLGDWHSGTTCQTVAATTFKMINTLKPEQVILHDVFDGRSVNHHSQYMSITKAKIDAPTLADELKALRKDLEVFAKAVKQVIVVKSNHDDWIARYIEDGKYIYDSRNMRKSLEIALAMLDNKDPVEFGIGEKIKNVRFLKRDEDYLIKGIQCGAHGDLEGSLVRIEKSFGKAITGHSHTAAKFRRVTRVGTSTSLRQSYAKGPISWTNSHAIINEDGTVQVINIILGEYKL